MPGGERVEIAAREDSFFYIGAAAYEGIRQAVLPLL